MGKFSDDYVLGLEDELRRLRRERDDLLVLAEDRQVFLHIEMNSRIKANALLDEVRQMLEGAHMDYAVSVEAALDILNEKG